MNKFYMIFANTPNGTDGSFLAIDKGSRRMYLTHNDAVERVRALIKEEPTREYYIVEAVSLVRAADVPLVFVTPE